MKIREINIDNMVEFLNSRDYTIPHLTNNSWQNSNRFGLKDYENLINDLILYFFDSYKMNKLDRNLTERYYGAPVNINETKRDKILRGVSELSFISMYPNIIVNLCDKKEILFSINEYAEIYKFIVLNHNEIEKHPKSKEENKYILRIIKNYLYMSSNTPISKIYVTNINYIIEYYKDIMNYLSTTYNDIIYTDTDVIYFEYSFTDKLKEIVNTLNIPYEIKNDVNMYIFAKKKYIYEINGEIKVKGLEHPNTIRKRRRGLKISDQTKKVDEIVNKFEQESRYKKIQKLKEKMLKYS
jgi:hypothetical protein